MTTDADSIVQSYPRCPEWLPEVRESSGPYALRFVTNEEDLDKVLKLRFEVFNLELREGLDTSYRNCRDVDDFDAHCHHLIVEDTAGGEVIGTYRLQTEAMSLAGNGFYSAGEFDLRRLAEGFLPNAVELGRACVASNHRNSRVLFLLWRGLAAYMLKNRKRYFFGCCSLTSQDPMEGAQVMQYLRTKKLIDPNWRVTPQREFECYPEGFVAAEPDKRVKLPRLMRMYMDYGARIAGPPAIDRQFKTIDYLAVFDMTSITARIKRMFVD